MPVIRVSMQAEPSSGKQWTELARSAEETGFDTLYVGDHIGISAAPFAALSAAASVTGSIRLGTCVLNAGRWEPLAIASEVATLDVLSGGRAVLGLGAGHTPAEWLMGGISRPGAEDRVDRLGEIAVATRRLLSGERVTLSGAHVRLHEASLDRPRPVQRPIPLMIGGAGQRILALASEKADIVGVTGLGRLRKDGFTHEAAWSEDRLDAGFDRIRSVGASVGRAPSVEALVQHVELTDDAAGAAERVAAVVPGASPADVLCSPFVWVGTRDEIVDQLREFETRWGIDRYVVREPAFGPATGIIEALAARGSAARHRPESAG